jgi:hypothetical protein
MKWFLVIVTGLSLGLAAARSATADGPVRQTLRGVGGAAVEGTRAVAQGAGAVARGTGQAAAGVARGAADVGRTVVGGTVEAGRAVVGGTAQAGRAIVGGTVDAGRAVVGGTARGVAAGVDAITPDIPWQARAGANLQAGDLGRDARWRFSQRNGDWWYYTPQNTWMYHRDGQWNQFSQDNYAPNPQFAGQYGVGYRGEAGQAGVSGQADIGAYNSGRVYRLHHDAYGREFIWDNGQRVYFDSNQSGQQQWGAGQQGQGPATPTPAIPTDPNATAPQAQGAASAQGQADAAASATTPAPAQPQADASASGAAAAGAAPAATPAPAASAPGAASDSSSTTGATEAPRDTLNNATAPQSGDAINQ